MLIILWCKNIVYLFILKYKMQFGLTHAGNISEIKFYKATGILGRPHT